MEILRVIKTGLGITIQDAGRPGMRRYGVPVSGVMDSYSAAWANRLVGNENDEAVIEWCLQGAEFEVLVDCDLALAGADTGGENWSAREFGKGERIAISGGAWGNWGYLAISGGWQSREYFGSQSVYERGGIGQGLRVGDILEAHPVTEEMKTGRKSVVRSARRDTAGDLVLRVQPSCQFPLFTEEQRTAFEEMEWLVSSRSDRSGFRLEGREGELAGGMPQIKSEAVLPGSVQITTGGVPIVVMPDGPTVGGYPKIGYLAEDERETLAQARAGTKVKFQFENDE